MKKILFIAFMSVAVFLSAATIAVNAGDISVQLQIPIPGLAQSLPVCTTKSTGLECTGIAQYIAYFYRWLVGIAAVLAVLALTWGGVRWLTSAGDTSAIGDAKKIMGNAIVGLAVAFCSYALLWAINPEFTQFNPLRIQPIQEIPLDGMEASVPPPFSTEKSGAVTGSEVIACGDEIDDGSTTTNRSFPGFATPAYAAPTPTTYTCPIPRIKLFNQRKYKNIKYGGCNTIAEAGCAPTSTAMVFNHYGKNVTPEDVAKVFADSGYRGCKPPSCTGCNGTNWGAFISKKTVGAYDMETVILHEGGINTPNVTDKTREDVATLLRENKPVIAGFRGDSVFTSEGHFMVLTGVDQDEDGNDIITINDPYGKDSGTLAPRCYKIQAKMYCGGAPLSYVLKHMKSAFYIKPKPTGGQNVFPQ